MKRTNNGLRFPRIMFLTLSCSGLLIFSGDLKSTSGKSTAIGCCIDSRGFVPRSAYNVSKLPIMYIKRLSKQYVRNILCLYIYLVTLMPDHTCVYDSFARPALRLSFSLKSNH